MTTAPETPRAALGALSRIIERYLIVCSCASPRNVNFGNRCKLCRDALAALAAAQPERGGAESGERYRVEQHGIVAEGGFNVRGPDGLVGWFKYEETADREAARLNREAGGAGPTFAPRCCFCGRIHDPKMMCGTSDREAGGGDGDCEDSLGLFWRKEHDRERARAEQAETELARMQKCVLGHCDLHITTPQAGCPVCRAEQAEAERDVRAEQVDALQQSLDEACVAVGGDCTWRDIPALVKAIKARLAELEQSRVVPATSEDGLQRVWDAMTEWQEKAKQAEARAELLQEQMGALQNMMDHAVKAAGVNAAISVPVEIKRLRASLERLERERDEIIKDSQAAGAAHVRVRSETQAELARLRSSLATAEGELERVHRVLASGDGLPEGCDDTYAERVGCALTILAPAPRAEPHQENEMQNEGVGVAQAPDEAKPCAHCGNENLCVEIRTDKYPGMTGFSVRCGSAYCGARGPVRVAQMDAVDEWNKVHDWFAPRAEPVRDAEELPEGDEPEQTMPMVDGKRFRCDACSVAVFTRSGADYICNGCGAAYVAEPAPYAEERDTFDPTKGTKRHTYAGVEIVENPTAPRDTLIGVGTSGLDDAHSITLTHREPAPRPQQEAREEAWRAMVGALPALLAYVERNECNHDETHRGGAIWTICDGCGKKWADDEGGFVPYEEPGAITEARAALALARDVEEGRP